MLATRSAQPSKGGLGATSRRSPVRHARLALVNRLPLTAALLLAVFALPQCGDDRDHPCEPGRPCPCGDVDICQLDCTDIRGCTPVCGSTVECVVDCGEDCLYDCGGSQVCDVVCGDRCTVVCESHQSCIADCGADCDYTCRNGNRCEATVGPRSQVTCESYSSCNITCTDDCEVRCNNPSSCNVTCRSGGPTTCADGTQACGPC